MIIINETPSFASSVRSILYEQLQEQIPYENKIIVRFESSSNSYEERGKIHFFESCSNYSPMAYFNFLKDSVIFQNMDDEPCVILQDYSLLTPSFSVKYFEYMESLKDNFGDIILPSIDIYFNENAVLHSSIIKCVNLRYTPSSNEFVEMMKENKVHPNSIIIDKIRNHPLLYIDKVPHILEYDPDISYNFLSLECNLVKNNHVPKKMNLHKFKLNGKFVYTLGSYYPQFSIINCSKVIMYTGKYSIEKDLEMATVSTELE
jgi:hypothetical protein